MTERPSTVRPATPKDEDALFELLCMAYKENAPFVMSEKKVRNAVHLGCCERAIIIGVSEENGKIAGSVGASFSQDWYSDDWYIGEMWNFVHPDHRKGDIRHGKNQIQYCKWLSENMNMALSMGILTSTRLEAKVRMYSREMEQVGALFVYNSQVALGPIGGGNRG